MRDESKVFSRVDWIILVWVCDKVVSNHIFKLIKRKIKFWVPCDLYNSLRELGMRQVCNDKQNCVLVEETNPSFRS